MEEWAKEWQEGDPDFDEESIEWLKKRPSSITKLLIRFPPSCLVQANRTLMCPAPGETGIVTSYFEPDDEHPEGMVSVRNHGTDTPVKAQCEPVWLNVVGYHRGITPEVVKKLLGEE